MSGVIPTIPRTHRVRTSDGFWRRRSGLVVPAGTIQGEARDGWEAGLFGPRTTNQEPRDGWESSLFPR